MDITQGTPDGAPLSPITGDWVLAHDAVTGRFVRHFTFALPTGGLADGFRWQSQTGFVLSFPTFDYDARAAAAPESAAVANSGSDSVRVTFPVPRLLLRVKVSGAQSGEVIEAHRVDGDAVTDEAFAQARHGIAGATLNAADRQLVLRQKRAGTVVTLRAGDVAQLFLRSPAASIRRLYRRSFEDQAPKRVFEFAGGSLTARQLTIDVPRGSALRSATLQ